MSLLTVPVSVGEVVDKITILKIKLKHIENPEKKLNVQKEYDFLTSICEKNSVNLDDSLFHELYECNQSLWNIEDDIRAKEKEKKFDDEFIELARSVYIRNDERYEIKRRVNLFYKSELIEEKNYAQYLS